MDVFAHRTSALIAAPLLTVALLTSSASPAGAATGGNGNQLRAIVGQRLGDTAKLSGGVRTWLAPPTSRNANRAATAAVHFGSNVDANDPGHDFAAGQSETAIAAQPATGGRRLVMAGWNDVSGFLASPTTVQGSATGVAISEDGGASFTDLIGLPNNNIDQQWSGDPAIASLGDGVHFAVASLYYPSATSCTDGLPANGTVALTIATVRHTTAGPTASFTAPVSISNPGDLCTLFGPGPPPDLSSLDKDWISYDPSTRTLAVSYTRFFFPVFVCDPNGCTQQGHSGNGQIEVARAHVPAAPTALSAANFGRPIVVWPEEQLCASGVPSSEQTRCGAVNQGAYVAVAGGDTYLAWERNLDSNFADGDPFIYEHAARIPAGAAQPSRGGTATPVVITAGQANGNAAGGVKSMNGDVIPGYSRGTGNDFPRLAVDRAHGRVVFVWNDASRHPLGDIWLRPVTPSLQTLGTTRRVDDGTSYALRFLPAVSIRTDGTICTSWYDRRRGGATSSITDYYAECRANPATSATDIQITTGATDWAGTSSLITPNFGDYTDNATDGTRTYFTWSDGRIGVPQPLVESR
jgi:hypothetical protein